MMKDDVPCLVEMNCRSHGWDGAWVPLANMLCGYAQPALALDSHINLGKFKEIPDVMPSPYKASGQAVMLVSYFAGTVKSASGYERMKKLSSFVALQTGYEKGSKVELTVDLFTAVGVLMLANPDKRQLEADLAEVRKMEKEGIFEFDEEVDPAIYQPSPDVVEFKDRRRASSSFDCTAQKAPAAPAPPYAVMAAVFGAGILAGILLSKKMK